MRLPIFTAIAGCNTLNDQIVLTGMLSPARNQVLKLDVDVKLNAQARCAAKVQENEVGGSDRLA